MGYKLPRCGLLSIDLWISICINMYPYVCMYIYILYVCTCISMILCILNVSICINMSHRRRLKHLHQQESVNQTARGRIIQLLNCRLLSLDFPSVLATCTVSVHLPRFPSEFARLQPPDLGVGVVKTLVSSVIFPPKYARPEGPGTKCPGQCGWPRGFGRQ